jgi:hypothetical protein
VKLSDFLTAARHSAWGYVVSKDLAAGYPDLADGARWEIRLAFPIEIDMMVII